MMVLMRTAFTDDYRARIKALGDIETDCDSADLHTMVQSAKASSNIVMSSVLMQQLQRKMDGKEMWAITAMIMINLY